MRLISLLLISLTSLFLTACAPAAPGCANLPGGGSYCLQNVVGPNFSTLQQSVLTAGKQRMTLLTRIENDTRGLRFAGMTPLGQTLLSVSWENGVLRSDLPAGMASHMNPVLLPAMVQIAFWPVEAVRAGLSPELELIEEHNRRRLRLINTESDDILDISWEGNLPYRRLKIVAPAGLRIDARALDEAEEAQ